MKKSGCMKCAFAFLIFIICENIKKSVLDLCQNYHKKCLTWSICSYTSGFSSFVKKNFSYWEVSETEENKAFCYNYNQKDRLEIGTKEIDIYIDNYFFHKFNLIQGTGEIAYVNPDNKNESQFDFGEEIIFTNEFINRNNIDSKDDNNSREINFEELREIKFASNLFDQCYETPYLPCGNNIKIQFISYYDDNKNRFENDELNEFYIGIKGIQIFDAEGLNILDKENL